MNQKLMWAVPFMLLLAGTTLTHAQISGRDNFDDNSRDVTQWSTDFVTGNGSFLETNQRLEYRVTSPDLIQGDDANRAWILNVGRYTNDWELVLDVTNTVTPTIVNQLATIGLEVFNAADLTDYCYLELYSSALSQLPFRRGFKAGLVVNDTDITDAIILKGDITNALSYGALRLVFSAQTKVFTAYTDGNGAAGGYQWLKLGSLGIAGSGGSITNGNWAMSANSTFQVVIYGYSQGLTVSSGQMHADNFSAQTAPASAPLLGCSLAGNSVRLVWPQNAVAYELESRTDLTTAPWHSVTNVPGTENGTNTMVLPLDTPSCFFRLRRN